MKAFNIKTNQFLEIFKAEEIIPNEVIPITDEQEIGIKDSLNNGGLVYFDESTGQLSYSGSLIKDHKWNPVSKQWEFSQDMKDARIERERNEMWEKIKEKRSESQQSGVYVKSVQNWVHTDAEAQRNYLFLKLVIDNPQFKAPYWKAMDGSYFMMTPVVYQDIIIQMYQKAQADFANGDKHYLEMMKSEEPSEYDFSTGWSESFPG